MADLSDETTQNMLRTIIREEVRPIIRQETADLRSDVQTIKAVVGAQGTQLQAVASDVNSLKHSLRQQAQEIHTLGVLFEDLDSRFSAASEQN